MGYLWIFLDSHFIPLLNEPSPIIVGPKLEAPQAFECGKRHFSEEQLKHKKMNEQKEATHKEPIESIKVWLLLGYPSNIL